MTNAIWGKRIPTLFGMFLIVVGIIATSFLVRTGVIFEGRASPSETPENIRITNLEESSFTISYTTTGGVLGSVTFGTDENFGNTAIDDADQNARVQPHTVHVVTVKNLKPLTKYFFAIVSGQTTFLNNGIPFTVTTAPRMQTQPSKEKTMRGKVVFPQKQSEEAVVYVTSAGTQTLATRVDATGFYTLSLSAFTSLSENSILQMLVVGKGMQSRVTLLANQINPVPTIVLSKDYDFTISTAPVASGSATIGFPNLPANPSASKTPQIVTPKKNEEFSDAQPLFKGTASPSAEVQVAIHSDENLTTKVTADKNGLWAFRPKTALSPGSHTITITTKDKLGIVKIVTQSFTVYAQGTQVGQSATPSATPTTLLPTAATTPTPTAPTPTLLLTATPIPTVLPTNLPTKPPAAKTLPPPGTPLVPLGISAILTTATGILLFFLTRGSAL